LAARPKGFYKKDGVTHPIMGRGSGRSNALNLGSRKPSPVSFMTLSEQRQLQRDRHERDVLVSEIKEVTRNEIWASVGVYPLTKDIQVVEVNLVDSDEEVYGISALNLKNIINLLERHGFELTKVEPFDKGITLKGERKAQ
jgi:hypothetical protein